MQTEEMRPAAPCSPERPSSARARALIGILFGMLLSLLAGGTAFWIITSRGEVLRDGETGLRHTSHLLAETAASTFLAIDKVLMGTAEVAGIQDRPTAMLQFLRRQLNEAPAARALLLIGPDGRTRVATNLADPYRPVDLSDRPYFRHHLEGRSPALFISGVIQSRNDERWIMVLSRRVESPDGAFAGVVAATINLEQMASILAVAVRNPEDSALLLTADGTILARHPDHGRHVGQSLASHPAFEAIRTAAEGSNTIDSPLDARRRLFAFYNASAYPVIAVATHEQDALLREWRRHSQLLGLVAAMVAVVIGSLALLLARQLERMDRTLDDLARSRQAADVANRAKSAFLANMSHELRTPLNAIIGFSDALRVGIPGHSCRERCHDYLGHVQSSGRHLLALINDILDLSKIEAGKVEIELAETHITPLAEECLDLVRGRAEAKAITLTLSLEASRPVAVIDPRRLRQILLNLLSNAVKFTPEGGRVALGVTCDSRRLTLTVEDTGIGMAADEVVVALSPFGQNPSAQFHGEAGTGLGLPLSKRLAEMHGGTLNVASTPGCGTTVTVVIPFPPASHRTDPLLAVE